MAFIQKGTRLSESIHSAFNETYGPKEKAIYPGIYQCVCGYEMVHDGGDLPASDKFPDEHPGDHQHVWRLLVSIYNPHPIVKYLEEEKPTE